MNWYALITISIVVVMLSFSICSVFSKFERFNMNTIDYFPIRKYERYETIEDAIFISIASYRDIECTNTIQSIFENATNPNNVYVGICEQNKDSSETCLVSDKYKNNIRKISLDYTRAKGPTFARYKCSTLWRGEQYYLQIDSHSIFEKDWDFKLIRLINKIKDDPNESNYPVISSYPISIDKKNDKDDRISEMYEYKMIGKIMTFRSRLISGVKYGSILRSLRPWAAAGFMFLESKFLYEVPFDPNLDHLFNGEEVLFSIRLFTNGWDFYVPTYNVIYHNYNRAASPLFHKDIKDSDKYRKNSEKRLHFLINNKNEYYLKSLNYYGIGTLRSISDFYKASNGEEGYNLRLDNKIKKRS